MLLTCLLLLINHDITSPVQVSIIAVMHDDDVGNDGGIIMMTVMVMTATKAMTTTLKTMIIKILRQKITVMIKQLFPTASLHAGHGYTLFLLQSLFALLSCIMQDPASQNTELKSSVFLFLASTSRAKDVLHDGSYSIGRPYLLLSSLLLIVTSKNGVLIYDDCL